MNETCPKCDREQPVDQFYADKRNRTGRMRICKNCFCDRMRRYRGRMRNNPEWVAKERARCQAKDKGRKRSGKRRSVPTCQTF